MARILRGEVRWANLSAGHGHEPGGERPVLVLSQDVFNDRSGTAIVMAITSQVQQVGFPLALELHSGGLPRRSWVKTSQVRTLSTTRLGRRLGVVSPEEVAQALQGLGEILGS